MVKRPIADASSTADPALCSYALPSPTTSETLERQNQMQHANGGNVLYPSRNIPSFDTLNAEQLSVMDSFLNLEKDYREGGWFDLCDSKLVLPAVFFTGEKVPVAKWNTESFDSITPTHAFKYGSHMTDLHSQTILRNRKAECSRDYCTKYLLRDALMVLGNLLRPRHSRKPPLRNPDRISEALQNVTLREMADEEKRRFDSVVSPLESELGEHQSMVSDSDNPSSDTGDEGDLKYEDYF